MVTHIRGIYALHSPIQSAHTHTHTEQWAAIYAAAPGSCWGFGASVVVLSALYIHSPHSQFLSARDSNLQPFDYESDSLTTRPQRPCIYSGGTGIFTS